MPRSAMPRQVAVFEESSLAEVQSDWVSNGTPIWVIDPDVSSIEQAMLDNANIQPRRQAVKDKIPGLKSESTLPLSMYVHAKGASAAEAAAATAAIQHTIWKSAWGGLDLGWAEGVASGDATNPVLESDPGIVGGDWGFFFDTSAGTGEFGRIESISTVTLTMFWDLGFTPDAGGADVMHAVIDLYPNEDALDDHGDANHTTLGWKVQGAFSEDVYECRGCKPSLGSFAITAGEPVQVQVTNKMVTWVQTPSASAFVATPSGEAPNVPGKGSTCSVKLADFGSAPATVVTRGTITFNPAIDHDRDKGANGPEGVHGYYGTGLGEATLEIIVEYDAAYDDEFEAGTKKHLIVQVGNTPTTAWALYFPRLEYIEKPKRVDEGGLVSSRLMFRCQEDTASVSGLTGDNIDKRRAPFHLLIAA